MAKWRGHDGAAIPEETPNTVSDKKNDQMIKGLANMDQAERERLADVHGKTYGAFLRNGGSD
jgi:hypothetical protein